MLWRKGMPEVLWILLIGAVCTTELISIISKHRSPRILNDYALFMEYVRLCCGNDDGVAVRTLMSEHMLEKLNGTVLDSCYARQVIGELRTNTRTLTSEERRVLVHALHLRIEALHRLAHPVC